MNAVKTKQNIPKGWLKTTIASECDLLRGRGLSKSDIDPLGKNKCLLYGELFTKYGEIIREVESRTNSKEGVKSEKGDVLIPGSTTTVAKDLAIASSLQESDVLLGGDINILRQKKSSYDPNFLAYYLTHHKNKELSSYAQGITIIHLSINKFKDLEICIPESTNEQKKIAEILETVDEEIQKTDEVITATEKLKRGLMQTLFTRGIGHTKFKKTKLGEIPEGWAVESFKDSLIEIIDGDRGVNYPKQSDFSNKGYCLFLSNKNIKNDAFLFDDCSFITKEKDEALRKGKLKRSDIVLTTRGTVGSVAFYSDVVSFENIRINSGMVILRASNSYDPEFLYHFMRSNYMKKKYIETTSGSAQPQLPIGSLEKILLVRPKLFEQKEIVAIAKSVDEKISINKKLKEKLIFLKKGLMQDLLSGRVRVFANQ